MAVPGCLWLKWWYVGDCGGMEAALDSGAAVVGFRRLR